MDMERILVTLENPQLGKPYPVKLECPKSQESLLVDKKQELILVLACLSLFPSSSSLFLFLSFFLSIHSVN
jgi:hypothetical protein